MSTASAMARSAAAQALARSGGDAAGARRLLGRAAGADPRLLAAIVEPHLEAIIARLIAAAATSDAPDGLSAEDLDRVMGALGERIGAKAQPRGITALIEPPVVAQAGARHQEAVRALAAAYRKPRPVRGAAGKAPKAPGSA